jgi:hypothetical protein
VRINPSLPFQIAGFTRLANALSTDTQGIVGLGMDVQREAVTSSIRSHGTIVAVYCPSRNARIAGYSFADSQLTALWPQSDSSTNVLAPRSVAKSSAGFGLTK